MSADAQTSRRAARGLAVALAAAGTGTACEFGGTCLNGVCQIDISCTDAGVCSDVPRDGGVTTGLVASTTFAAVNGCPGAEGMRLPRGRYGVLAAADGFVWVGDFSSTEAKLVRVTSQTGVLSTLVAAVGFSAPATSQAQSFRLSGHRIYWLDKAGGRAYVLDGDAMAVQAVTTTAGVTGFDVDPQGRYGYQSEDTTTAYVLAQIDLQNKQRTPKYTESRASTRGILLALVNGFLIVNVTQGLAPGLYAFNASTGTPQAPQVTTTNNRAYGDASIYVWSRGTTGNFASTFSYGPASPTPGATTTKTQQFNPAVNYAVYAPPLGLGGPTMYFAGSTDASRDWVFKVDLATGQVPALGVACTVATPRATLGAIAIDGTYVYVATENSSDSAALWRFKR